MNDTSSHYEAVRNYKLEHFKESGIKSEIAKLHYDMIMSCLPVYEMIAMVKIEF